VIRETGEREVVIESDQTSLLINEEKHIHKIKYNNSPCGKKIKTIFLLKKLINNKQKNVNNQEIFRPWSGRKIL